MEVGERDDGAPIESITLNNSDARPRVTCLFRNGGTNFSSQVHNDLGSKSIHGATNKTIWRK